VSEQPGWAQEQEDEQNREADHVLAAGVEEENRQRMQNADLPELRST